MDSDSGKSLKQETTSQIGLAESEKVKVRERACERCRLFIKPAKKHKQKKNTTRQTTKPQAHLDKLKGEVSQLEREVVLDLVHEKLNIARFRRLIVWRL